MLKVERDEQNVIFVIDDEGEGMFKEMLSKIFMFFFIIKLLGEGIGLGMFILMIIVEQYNGKINIVSEEGKGIKVLVIFFVV